VVFTEQTECPICLESLSLTPEGQPRGRADGQQMSPPSCQPLAAGPSGVDDGVWQLPCNHRFHTECIGEWLQRETRCPVCRQATHGVDRVLEIVF
jgi:hypothetical protein